MSVTLRDVALRAGTSTTAVSAVLNQPARSTTRVSQATRERILRAAAEMGYRPNPVARSLVTGRSHVFGIAFPYVAAFYDCNPFNVQLLSGLVEGGRQHGYDLMLHTGSLQEGGEPTVESLTDLRTDGLILVLGSAAGSVPDRCRELQLPLLAVVFHPEWGAPYTINCDDLVGGRLATEHLLGLGHRRIAHLSGRAEVASTEPRCAGYRAALHAAGVTPDPALEVGAEFSVPGGREAIARLLALPPDRRPTALFAANDLSAHGAILALRQAGLRIPEDMAVVGYDDTWYAADCDPPLTSVHMPIHTMGLQAIQRLAAVVRGETLAEPHLVLAPTLTVRQSCGAPPPEAPSPR